jgi:L-aspartate oxidase
VKTDLWGRTSLAGLYAAGETAATGVHGANRLASNSLLEGLVFGARAGQAMIQDAPVGKRSGAALPGSPAPLPENSSAAQKEPPKATSKASPACATLTKIRDVMWREVGILRSGKELTDAIKQLEAQELPKAEKPGRTGHELRNMHALAMLIARSGLAREESRGSHYRSDFPYRNDEEFGKHSAVQKNKDIRFEL